VFPPLPSRPRRHAHALAIALLAGWIFGGHGVGAAAATALTAMPSSLDLGSVQAPSGHAAAETTLTNAGTTEARFGIAYPYPAGSVLPSAACFRAGEAVFVLHAGESCLLGLDLAASAIAPAGTLGSGTSTLQLIVNGGEQMVPIALAWNLVPMNLDVDTTPVAFPATEVGSSRPAEPRVVRNNADVPLDIVTSWSGLFAPDCSGHFASGQCASEMAAIAASFAVDTSSCHPIPAHGSCTLAVAFTPQDAFAMAANLVISARGNATTYSQTLFLSGLGVPRETTPGTLLAVEFVNQALGEHYFVTADANEVAALDAGRFTGWQRTGRSFRVFAPGSSVAGTAPVCRFYGRPEAGLASHFYSASAAECAAVRERFGDAWLLESSDVFAIFRPDPASGACPAGSSPVYRLYDERSHVSHRYVTDRGLRAQMVLAGWIAEGYGPDAVAMCAPQ
jgi:hypothetical protein